MQYFSRSATIALLTLLASPVLTSGYAQAAGSLDAPKDSAFAAIGLGGLDFGYAKRFNPSWGGRVLLNSGIKADADNVKIHGNRYDAAFKTSPGIGVLADFYPINDSGFRVSGGLYLAKQKYQLDGRSNTSYSINGHSYSSAQLGQFSGETRFRSLSPYIGVGWESKPSASGWRFVSDLGVKLLSTSSNRLDASGAASNAALRSDLAAEQKHLRGDGVELMASIGVSYAF